MLSVKVELPNREQVKLLRFLSPKRVQFAEKEALNQARNDGQRLSLRLVAKYMGIPESKLKKRGKFLGGKKYGAVSKGRNASMRKLYTSIIYAGRPFNVKRYNANVVKEGRRTIGVFHSAWGTRRFIEGAFELQKKGTPILIRSASKGYARGVYGPGVAQTWQNDDSMRKQVVRRVQRRFKVAFRGRLRYAFSSESHIR